MFPLSFALFSPLPLQTEDECALRSITFLTNSSNRRARKSASSTDNVFVFFSASPRMTL
jgi:hypothetical protein